jgi:hypothetical protein
VARQTKLGDRRSLDIILLEGRRSSSTPSPGNRTPN